MHDIFVVENRQLAKYFQSNISFFQTAESFPVCSMRIREKNACGQGRRMWDLLWTRAAFSLNKKKIAARREKKFAIAIRNLFID
jgi:hypothetical protein